MCAPLLVITAAVGLLACAISATADVSATQSAAWTQRKVHLDFGHAPVVNGDSAPWQEASCDRLFAEVKVVLVKLGARANDVDADQRGCYGSRAMRSDDIRFTVLAPQSNAAGEAVEARWQPAELTGNCEMIQYLSDKVLPLVSARNVQHMSKADCERSGVGLRAEVLVPTQPAATSP